MSDNTIKTAIRQLAGTHLADKVYMASCEIVSVDIAKRTCSCTLIDGGAANVITATLMASVDDGILIIPAINSTVKVIFSDYVQPFVCQYSEVDKIIFRGGDLGGLVKVITLTERLNILENDINMLKTAMGAWIPVPNDGGAALKVAAGAWIGETLVPTVQTDIENLSITQG